MAGFRLTALGVFVRRVFAAHEDFEAVDLLAGTEDDQGVAGADDVLGGGVASNGDMYLIEGFALWQMGEHTPSNGRATCGFDLTDVIEESPHGRSKLQLLEKVGTLA